MLSPVISKLCAVYRNRSCVALFNSMVYKINNTLTICQMRWQNLGKTQCCAAAAQPHLRLWGFSNPFSRAVRNERTASCADVCALNRTEVTAPVADMPNAPHKKHAVCVQLWISAFQPVCRTGVTWHNPRYAAKLLNLFYATLLTRMFLRFSH